MRVLVAEDEPLIAMGLELMLTQLGHEVVGVCSDGSSCVEAALLEKPDVIFMDVNMETPAAGFVAANAISAQLSTSIVYTTAYDDNEVLAEVEKSGNVRFILKPFDDSAIANVLDSLTSAED